MFPSLSFGETGIIGSIVALIILLKKIFLLFFKKFVKKSNKNKKYFSIKSNQKKLFNLRKFVTDNLQDLGADVDQINVDTFAEKSNYFSYRRSCKLHQKDYGRCISAVSML